MEATIWALLPPIIAIVLALITKEVYISLMIGIIAGALLLTGITSPIEALNVTFDAMSAKIGGNVDILVFLVLLGIIVALISKSGASRSYGEWASQKIKSRRGALLSTSGLGALIFVDDYFNCLTVGTVMRPVTDRHKISRAKLAYIIDATAAPICIIAPISSWAAAVSSSLPEGTDVNGFQLFMDTIPFNLYALFTILFMLFLVITNMDFFSMKKVEAKGDNKAVELEHDEIKVVGSGKVLDLVLPILVLIVSCIGFMLYTGGFTLKGVNNAGSFFQHISDGFANCSSSRSLVLGSFITILFILVLYLVRRIINFKQFCESFTEGFKAMVPAILILCLAWTLSAICDGDHLNLRGFVEANIAAVDQVKVLVPAIFFLISLGLAFSTGTSWGTFAILIPVAVTIYNPAAEYGMLVVAVAAVLAGAVCGDHVSPISDTTILASAGAQCNHIEHVSTQLPYALSVAGCCLIGFLFAGIFKSGALGLLFGFVALIAMMLCFYFVYHNKEKKQAANS